MNSKRPLCEDTPGPHATVLNTVNGARYNIDTCVEFAIGRSIRCAISLLEPFISECHCIIFCRGSKFYLQDRNSVAGTYLNCELLPKNSKYTTLLEHGDLISFSDTRTMKYIYKFCLSKRSTKKPKSNEETSKLIELSRNFQKTLDTLHVDIINLKVEKSELRNYIQRHMTKFSDLMEKFFDNVKAEVRQMYDDDDDDNDDKKSTHKVTMCGNTYNLEQEVLSSVHNFKDSVYEIVEKELSCAICSEIILKAHTTNCNHTFCEGCINKWLTNNNCCPSCRTQVIGTNYCLSLDNFVTSLCSLLGGSPKYFRDNLIQERNECPIFDNAPGPSTTNNPGFLTVVYGHDAINRVNPIEPYRIVRYDYLSNEEPNSEVIMDLTEQNASAVSLAP